MINDVTAVARVASVGREPSPMPASVQPSPARPPSQAAPPPVAERPAAVEPREVGRLSDTWRTRIDPETMRVFTEIVDPVTREPLYRVPPQAVISDKARAEGESLARQERRVRDLVL